MHVTTGDAKLSAGSEWWRKGHYVGAFLLLAAWAWLPPVAAGWLFLPVWALLSQLIFAGSFEAAKLRRRVWLEQYLLASSPWHRWLRGGLLMIVWHQLIAVFLALLLVVKLRLLVWSDWLALSLGLMMLMALSAGLRAKLAPHVVPAYLAAVGRRMVVLPASAALTAMLIAVALLRSQPHLVGLSWNQAMTRELQLIPGDSLLDALLRLGHALEITQFWGMQNAVQQLEVGTLLLLLGWGMLFLVQSAFAWSFIRLLVGVDAICQRRRDVRNEN